jgi:Fe-S-cluster containining protein
MPAKATDPRLAQPLDCRACAACCRNAADGRVPVSTADLVRWRRAGLSHLADGAVPGHFGELGMPARSGGACRFLGGAGAPNDCSIYPDRPSACAKFAVGSRQCLEARRLGGL